MSQLTNHFALELRFEKPIEIFIPPRRDEADGQDGQHRKGQQWNEQIGVIDEPIDEGPFGGAERLFGRGRFPRKIERQLQERQVEHGKKMYSNLRLDDGGKVDLVIGNATVITMNASRDVISDAEIVVQGNRIVGVGPRRRGRRTHPHQYLDVGGQVVLPGLIHSHLHACQTIFRNRADGLELLDWLSHKIWPFEAAHDARTLRASADLTFLECVRSGATAVLDMGTVHHYDAVFESARDIGIRLVGGKCMMDIGAQVPSGLSETTEESLRQSLRLVETWHGAEGDRLRYAFAPRFVLSCSEPLLHEVVRLTHEKNLRIHTHASENKSECAAVRAQTGHDNIIYFQRLGLLGRHATLAHCVWLNEEEVIALASSQTAVAHCPSSNFKLASGIAQIPELRARGIAVGLGADGAPCNNNLDIFQEMRLAALIHLPRVGPRGFSAMDVLEMATLHGATALGLTGEIGCLVEGARADLITVDLSAPHVVPEGPDVVSTLVYSAQSRDVRDVIIDGRLVMQQRQVLTVDEAEVGVAAREAALAVQSRLA